MTEQWALLWSKQQNALHVEPVERMLSLNRVAYREDAGGDYRVLFLGSQQEVNEAAEAVRATMTSRAEVLRLARKDAA